MNIAPGENPHSPATGQVTLPFEQPVEPSKPLNGFWATFSWALYDLANTIYSAAVVSVYWPAFIKDDLKVNDIWYALPAALAALLVGLFSPLMGRISDRGGNRLTWLLWSTVLRVSALFLMGLFPVLGLAVALFVVANSTFQAALMFYDALLPSVSNPKNWGKVSGMGVGLGYLGGITGFLLVPVITGLIFGKGANGEIVNSNTFLVTAAMYGLLSLPCLLFVKERKYLKKADQPPITWRNSLSQTWQTIQQARQYPGLFIFLLSNFFYSDAVNTVIVAMGIYSTQVIGFTSAERNNFLAFSTIFAVVGSFGFGYLADKLGPKKSLNISLIIWIFVFLFAIATPPSTLFFFVGGPLAGIALGSVWVTARTLMIELTPPERLGEFMGIYNLTGKIAGVFGPLVWGLTLFLFDPAAGWGKTGYQIAVASLLVLVVIGFILHQRVPVTNRHSRGEEYIQAEVPFK
jgi:UMF1 family MFS transporter